MTITRDRPTTTGGGSSQEHTPVYQALGKAAFDRVVGFVLAVLTLPFLALLALLCRIAFGSPGIRRAVYLGMNGTPFTLYKLASDEHAVGETHNNRLGRFLRDWSLDELPQLWNVVLGDMSLVGPRPITSETAAEFSDWQLQRQQVKPGITGLWQVNGRGDGRKMLDNIHYDIQYLDQISFLTDLRILVRTATAFAFRREGSGARSGPRVWDQLRHKRLVAADVGLWLIALIAGTLVRFDFAWNTINEANLLVVFGLAAAAQFAFGSVVGMYWGRWRLASFEEMAWVAGGTAAVTALLLTATTWFSPLMSRGAIVAAGAFHLMGSLTARYVARVAYTSQQRSVHRRPHRLLVMGAGEIGLSAVQAIWADPESPFEPVALLDDDHAKLGVRCLGLAVMGSSADIAAVARRYGADSLLVAIPSAPPPLVRSLTSAARVAGLSVEVLPPLVESVSQRLVAHARTRPEPTKPYQPSRTPGRAAARQADEPRQFDLAIVGLGYVGLPAAMEASRIGVRVLGLDINQDRIGALQAGTSYIEDVSSESVQLALEGGFVATTDSSLLAEADAITISVPTPLRDELPDLTAVIGASEAIGDYLQPGQLVILESTTYPGTTEEVVRPILEQRSGLTAGEDFYLAYSPERIDPGNPDWGIHNTPKLVAGIDEASTQQAAMLYQKFAPVVTLSGTREAEMAKLLENTYRHVNIALVNEMAIFCQQLGVDIWETIRGAATKPFGFQAFYPGPGVGGHCIPIDPNYLSYRVRQLGEQFRFIELAQEINQYMPRYVAERAMKMLEDAGKTRQGSTVLLLGVAYKPDVGDTRETPATAVGRELLAAGVTVRYVDPHVTSFDVDLTVIEREEDAIAAVAGADLTLIHTAHSDFDIGAITAEANMILDARGVADPRVAQRL